MWIGFINLQCFDTLVIYTDFCRNFTVHGNCNGVIVTKQLWEPDSED